MIRVSDLILAYPTYLSHGGYRDVLRKVSFTVAAGDALTITGASGSGKSTLLHVLAGLAPRHTGGQASGSADVAGCDVLAHSPDLGKIGLLFQDATTQLFSTTAEQEVAWGLEALGLSPAAISTRVRDALTRFELWDLRKRAPWALSGGQQKRLALAVLWAMNPTVLLFDEPLGGLDPSGRAEVLEAIETLREMGHTTVLTSLRPQLMELSATTLLLDQGALVWSGASSRLLSDPSLLVDSGVLYPAALWPEALKGAHPCSSEVAVELHAVHYTYPGGVKALRGVDLQLMEGQFTVLVGPNGAGKSTLARHINGLLRPSLGTVRVRGRSVAGRPVGAMAREVGFLFQRPEQQLFSHTVRDEVGYGPRRLELPDAADRVTAALAQFGLDQVAELPPSLLSYGEQRAVTLASLAAIGAPILVLDEPSVGLDGRGWRQLLSWIAGCRAQGVTLIVITHEPELAACADRVIQLHEGRLVGDGPPDVAPAAWAGRGVG